MNSLMPVDKEQQGGCPPRDVDRYCHHRSPDLPAQLTRLLREGFSICLMQATDRGTVFVIQAPTLEIRSLPQQVPICLSYELYRCWTAPVVRTLVKVHDEPKNPLTYDTFINIKDQQQRNAFGALGNQRQVPVFFYDEDLHHHQLTMQADNSQNREDVALLLYEGEIALSRIPEERFDFDRGVREIQLMMDKFGTLRIG